MQRRSFSLVLVVVLLAAISGEAAACTCPAFSLQSRYSRAANVFTAVIVDEYTEASDQDTPIRSTFRITEAFKGQPPFAALISHPFDGTCGIDLQIGAEYLFFTGGTGEISLCSGIRTVQDAAEHIGLLRALNAGARSDLAEPWRFSAADDACLLEAQFDLGEDRAPGHVHISTSYERAGAQRGNPQFDFAEATVSNVVPFAPEQRPGPLVMIAGGEVFTASWTTGRVIGVGALPHPLPLPDSHTLLGEAVIDLVVAMADTDSLLVRHDAQGFGPSTEWRVQGARQREAAAEMLACIDATRAPSRR